MRNLQPRFTDRQVADKQDVQVQSSRAVGKPRRPVPAELLLDGQQSLEELPRLQLRLQRQDRVDKMRLAGKPNGISSIERRPANCPAQRFEAQGRCLQRILGSPCPTGQIGAHSDVGSVHPFQSTAVEQDKSAAGTCEEAYGCGTADRRSVCPKSSPFQSTASRLSRARA